jgi:uncharacterized protein YdeI (YjbR/CyaY-like superfamily)
MNFPNPNVDFYFVKAKKWQAEMLKLREIILTIELNEELKWGCPCYTFQKSNVVLIHDFKEYCAVLFFKGALLKDENEVLIQQTENVQSARQMRFTNIQEVNELETILKTYIYEAIEVEKAGLKVELKKPSERKLPEEFSSKLEENLLLKTAFEALSPGRQNAYIYFFSQPKQTKTRAERVDKSIPQILIGKGIND